MNDAATTLGPGAPENSPARGRRTALIVAAIGIVVLVAAGVAGRSKALEWWYTRQLETGTGEEKLEAAAQLGNLGSDRAVEWLFEELLEEYRAALERSPFTRIGKPRDRVRAPFSHPANYLRGARAKLLLSTLARTGNPALPTLLRAFVADHSDAVDVSWVTLCEMAPELWNGPVEIPILGLPSDGSDRETRSPIDFESRALEELPRDSSRTAAVRRIAAEVLGIRRHR